MRGCEVSSVGLIQVELKVNELTIIVQNAACGIHEGSKNQMDHYGKFKELGRLDRQLFVEDHGLLVEPHQAYLVEPVGKEEVDHADGVHEGHPGWVSQAYEDEGEHARKLIAN